MTPTTAPTDALYQQLGCGQTYQYESKDPLSAWQGTGSFCPDTPDNRRTLHDNMKLGYLPGYCDTCLGVPANQVFVIWKLAPPNCPDQCPEPF